MTAQKTRCPFCESVFAVTPEQLAARGGHVRCGKCFQVFKADDHLVSDTPPAVKPLVQEAAISSVFDLLDEPAAKAPVGAVTLAGQSPHVAKDLTAFEKPADLDADFEGLFAAMAPVEVDLNQGYAQTSQSDLTGQQKPPVATVPERVQDTQPPGLQKSLPKQLSAIKPLFVEESDHPKPTAATANLNGKAKAPALVLDDEFSDLFLGDKSQKMEALRQDELSAVEKLSAAADESWAEALLQEESNKGQRQEISPPPPKTKAKPAETRLPKSELVEDLPKADGFSSANRPKHDDDDLLSFLSKAGATTNGQMEALAPLPNKSIKKSGSLPPPPASHRVLTPTKTPVPWFRLVSWGFASVLMLILLVVQYFYFNFDHMVSSPKSHSLMVSVCSFAGCSVPTIDANQIELRKITAKKHPTQPELTRFTLTMINHAPNSQPMPALKLTIRENGQIKAGRLIQPIEYLYGPATGITRIAPNSPLRLSVDLRIKRKSFEHYQIDPTY